jgi:PTH1 family peptidyl-tRNA hydrolase
MFKIFLSATLFLNMSWVIVGLGNPGEEYALTRHNAGRLALEFFAKKTDASAWKEDKKSQSLTTGARIGSQILALVLPNTYMNKSGAAVGKFVKSVRAAERLVVIQDELDMPLGSFKLSYDRGSGGHKGIESIMRAVKTKRFTRIRVGVSPATATGKLRKPSGEKEVADFILARFKSHEMDELKKVFKKIAEAIECIVTEGPQIAMNRFN